jgi:ATP-binding cassette subfamily C (CFTR/MRP) protein 4
MVDGVDISELGLHKLRTGLSVINQYPVLFSGCTVRENLDPFGRYSKEEVVEALTDVQMIEVVNALPQGMNSQVADGGMNFSVGERQLLCLARAMLQKSKILVLDEPTANVDGRTDKLLQQAVDKSFKGATIISVAHRLDTIIENDLILVLGRGEVLEFGSPSELLSIEDGQFTSMVNDTGAEMSRALKATAMRNQK